MKAVRPIRGIQVTEHELEFVRQIKGVQVKDLITKFFYNQNQLCFQIMLHLEGGETVHFQEFTDYGAYKKALGALQQARENDTVIKIPGKNMRNAELTSKVA